MNDIIGPAQARQNQQSAFEISFMDVLLLLAKRKKLIIGMTLLAAVGSVAISLVLPITYRATTKLLPPQQAQSGAAALLSQLGGVAGAVGAGGLKSPNDLYVGMLKSRTVSDKLIARYDLKKVYGTASHEKAAQELQENTVITSGKDGLITIEVEDERKDRVAPLANGYVEELFNLTKVLAVTEASKRRMFFERQLELSKNNLADAEVALKSGLNRGGVISVDGDSRAIVETIGRLRAQISAKEIELNSMRAFVTTSNPEFRRTEEELSSARAELSKLENGRPGALPLAKQAAGEQGGLENIRILRDVKYHQMLYEMLAKQYEVARLDEAKDPSVIQVLDRAVEPERKFKPRRAFIVVLSTLLALVLSVVWAFLVEIKERTTRSSTGAAQWAELKSSLRLRPKK